MKLFQSASFSASIFFIAFSAQAFAIDESNIRYCPADAGSLMNSDGECKFYTNGCERLDLVAAGYKDQCNVVYLSNPFVEIDDAQAPCVESLVTINNIKIKRSVQHGCDVCDVEPIVVVKLQFTHVSCAEHTFELTIDSNDVQKGVKNIYIKDLSLFDCFGPLTERKYNFQWSEYESANQVKFYTVANPVLN